MRRTSVRLALAAAGLAAVGLAVPAGAASAPSKLTFTDESGDALVGGSDDAVKMTWTTSGTTTKKKVRGRTVTTYTPKNLVVTLETAEAIDTSGTTQYDIEGAADGCGDFYVYVAPGSALEGLIGSCGDDDAVDFAGSSFEVKGNAIVFTVPLGTVPGIAAGKTLTALDGYTGSVDPVTGEIGAVLIGGTLANDTIATDSAYKIG
jgi:hypothetical protein